jgi:sugar O-acyltransferase (sialic acid O-acetyltransferase NeuD family)
MSSIEIPVVILGAGGFSASVYEMLNAQPNIKVVGCTDKAQGLSDRSLDDDVMLRILGDDTILPELAEKYPGLNAVFALGPDLMEARLRLMSDLAAADIPAMTAVHDSAVVSSMARIGAGTVIREGAIISAAVHIGACCLLNLQASIDHDARLAPNVYVGQGVKIASHAQIGENVVIEMGASINSRVTIGAGARVVGGAFVNTDVPENAVVVGVPAQVVRYVNEES